MLMDFLHNVFQNEKTTDTTVISCLVSGTYDSRHHTKRISIGFCENILSDIDLLISWTTANIEQTELYIC